MELVEFEGIRYAEIIWSGTTVEKSTFFSPDEASFQFGILAHKAGFLETAHYHHPVKREINDMQQMFIVQYGKVGVQFFDKSGELFKEVILQTGDAISLVHGAHAIRVIEDMQCISIKQGPFLGVEMDKINIEVKK